MKVRPGMPADYGNLVRLDMKGTSGVTGTYRTMEDIWSHLYLTKNFLIN